MTFFRLIYIKHGHAVDGSILCGVCRRVNHVASSYYYDNIGFREFRVDVVHLAQLVVGHVHFGKEYVHVSGHPAGYRVDGELDLSAFGLEGIHEPLYVLLRSGRLPCRSRAR